MRSASAKSEVDIISHSIPGMIHGFIEMAGVLNVSPTCEQRMN